MQSSAAAFLDSSICPSFFRGFDYSPNIQNVHGNTVSGRVITPHRRSRVGDAHPFDRPRVIRRQPLPFDNGNTGHAICLANDFGSGTREFDPAVYPAPISFSNRRTPAAVAKRDDSGFHGNTHRHAISMVSIPTSSMIWSASAIMSRSLMQQLAPKPHIVSYSNPDVT